MSSEFDFRIKQSAYVQALETYRRAEERLLEEREAQRSNLKTMSNSMEGNSADALEIATGSFFSPYGAYDKAWAQVKCMRELMEDTLPEMNALMARCEEFPEQLRSDYYIEPIRPAAGNNTSRNGDILSLNYDKIAVLKDTCDKVSELAQQIGDEMVSIMQSCSGPLGGVNHDMEMARAAQRKLQRVRNYKDSFQKYEFGVRALEFDMNLGFSRLANGSLSVAREAGISYDEWKSQIMDMGDTYNVLYMSEEEIRQIFENENEALIQIMANNIFSKEVSEWTDRETEYIAESLNYAIKNKKLDIIEVYAGSMLEEEYTELTTVSFDRYQRDYCAHADTDMIELIMSKLNPKSQGEAYYTLNRISNMDFETVTVVNSNMFDESGASYTVDAELADGKIQISFVTEADEKFQSTFGKTKAQTVLTVYDMQEIVTIEEAGRLSEIGFTLEDVEGLRMGVATDEDVMLLDKLAARDYVQAFDTNPNRISNSMGNSLTEYIMMLSLNNQVSEVESMVNGVLATDPENNSCIHDTRGQYLTLIRSNLLEYIDLANINILLYENGSKEAQTIIQNTEKIYQQYGLWSAVDRVYNFEFGFEELELMRPQYANGYIKVSVSELELGKESSYKIHFVDSQTGADAAGGCYGKVTATQVSGTDYARLEGILDIQEMERKREDIVINTVKKSGYAMMDKIIPGSSVVINLAETYIENGMKADVKDVITAQSKFPFKTYIEPYGKSEELQFAHGQVNEAIKAYFEYEKLGEEIEEKQQYLHNLVFSQGIAVGVMLYDEEEVSIKDAEGNPKTVMTKTGDGVMLPQATLNLHRWEEEGIKAYLEDCGIDVSGREYIVERLLDKNTGDANMQTMINGGDISAMDADEISRCIISLNAGIGNAVKLIDDSIRIEDGIDEWITEGAD